MTENEHVIPTCSMWRPKERRCNTSQKKCAPTNTTAAQNMGTKIGNATLLGYAGLWSMACTGMQPMLHAFL